MTMLMSMLKEFFNIVSLFNILRVTHDTVMLCVFPITLTGAGKTTSRNNQYLGFAQASFHLTQEGDATLYQAWERYNDLIYKCPTHDLNIHQKVNIFYKGLDTITHQLLDSQGPIPNKTPNQALEAIRTMTDHSHKWHDVSNSRKVSSGSSDGIAAIANKLDSLGRDMKNLKENVHAIQVGCETCGGVHLDKECPLSEDVKSVKEVKYSEFGRSFPNNNKNNARYRCKAIFADNKAPGDETFSNGTNELHGVSFVYDDNVMVSKKTNEGQSGVLPC
ncbi:hypothetical protein Tco_1413631 [Tanacetum coccineum]